MNKTVLCHHKSYNEKQDGKWRSCANCAVRAHRLILDDGKSPISFLCEKHWPNKRVGSFEIPMAEAIIMTVFEE